MNVMGNSTGYIRKHYAFHHSCMKRKSEKKTREALEINKLKTNNEKDKTFTVLNRDNGDYVTTNPWKPLFIKMETIQFEKHLCKQFSLKTAFFKGSRNITLQ